MDTVRAIWSILSARERSTAAGLLLLLLGGTLLEMLGIGVVVPAVMVLVSAPGDQQIPAIDAWLARLGHPPHAQLVLAGLVGLFLLYAAKAAYLLLAAYCQSRFVAGLQTTLGKRLFTAYMSQPWADHIRRNSAKMIHQIGELHSFADLCSLAISTFSELLVLAGIVLLLMWFEPLGASVVGGVFLVAAGLLGWWTRGPTRKWGETRLEHATLALQHMRQGFGGLKDAKILRRERHFIGRFARHADLVTRMATRQLFVGQVPRLWFELNAVAALCLLTAVMLREGRPPQVIVPTLALFATAAFRALPSLNRMSSAFHHLAFASGMVAGLRRDLEGGPTGSPPGPTADLAFRDSIALEGVSFRHDGRPENSVDEVTIRIPHGSSVGLIGGSGAGKSTLVDLILGLLPPSRGRITVDGVDIHDNLPGWQRKLGYVGQIIYLTDESIRSNVAFGLPDELIDDAAVNRALAAARLDGFVAGLPDGVNTLVGERGVRLSGGQRQRIGIARALYGDPEVLLLDEATSNLDDETEREVMAAVNSLHGVKTLIIVAHRMSTVADCDVLHRLAAGRVVQSGTLGEVVSP